jgi:hypothetical protein
VNERLLMAETLSAGGARLAPTGQEVFGARRSPHVPAICQLNVPDLVRKDFSA